MITSPLRLEIHFFTNIHVSACPEGCTTRADGEMESHVEFMQHKEEPRKWMVSLGVKQEADGDNNYPDYTFDIEIVGLFEVAPEYPDDKMENMVRANGPAVLFGAVREMVSNLTARGPFGRVDLPTVSFIDEANLPEGQPAAAVKQSVAKSAVKRTRKSAKKVDR